jgi:hypothetical protein
LHEMSPSAVPMIAHSTMQATRCNSDFTAFSRSGLASGTTVGIGHGSVSDSPGAIAQSQPLGRMPAQIRRRPRRSASLDAPTSRARGRCRSPGQRTSLFSDAAKTAVRCSCPHSRGQSCIFRVWQTARLFGQPGSLQAKPAMAPSLTTFPSRSRSVLLLL